jgi:transmembrane sensor
MNQSSIQEHPSASVRAEAAAWVARLHGAERSRALEDGFRRWLEMDPAHARAFEIATEAWELGGSLRRSQMAHTSDSFSERHTLSPFARRVVALAAAMCAVLVGTLLYFNLADSAVSTQLGEQRMFTLNDGTRILLNTDTRIILEESDSRRHVRLEKGEALFEVSKDPLRPFVVTTGGKDVVALGTSFIVRHEPNRLAVTLMEGRVAVSPVPALRTAADVQTPETMDDQAFLEPGQRLTFQGRELPVVDRPQLEIVTAWRRGEVVLENTPLQDAAEEMNRYSEVKLVIDDPRVADIRISGIFRTGDSVRFAHAVAESYQLAVDREPRRIVISPTRN